MSIFVYSPLSGITYIDLPDKLKNLKKGLISIKKRTINAFFGVILDI